MQRREEDRNPPFPHTRVMGKRPIRLADVFRTRATSTRIGKDGLSYRWFEYAAWHRPDRANHWFEGHQFQDLFLQVDSGSDFD